MALDFKFNGLHSHSATFMQRFWLPQIAKRKQLGSFWGLNFTEYTSNQMWKRVVAFNHLHHVFINRVCTLLKQTVANY